MLVLSLLLNYILHIRGCRKNVNDTFFSSPWWVLGVKERGLYYMQLLLEESEQHGKESLCLCSL